MKKDKYIIDCDTWNCASFTDRGFVALLNPEGNKCCLGFISEQSGVEPVNMRGVLSPFFVETKWLRVKSGVTNSPGNEMDIIAAAISINDESSLTLKERVERLRALFKKHGVKLVFKNLKKYL